MNLAYQALDDDDLSRARHLLEPWIPVGLTGESAAALSKAPQAATDFRGWEWHYLWHQTQGEERFILGYHTNGATAVGVLPDGKTAFSAGRDRCVRLWDLESRQQVGLLPHSEEVFGAAASPDGHWLATVTENVRVDVQPVRLWNLTTKQIEAVVATNYWPRSNLAFSPDSRLLAYVDNDITGVHVWDILHRRELTNLPAYYPAYGPLGLAFSPDNRTLAYNETIDGLIRLWDLVEGSSRGELAGHSRYVFAIAFSPDGKKLAYATRDRTVTIWTLEEQRNLFVATNRNAVFGNLAFSPDGHTLAVAGEQQIQLIDVRETKPAGSLKGHLKPVTGLAYTPDGQTLLSASADGTVRVWNPSAPVPRSACELPPDVSILWNSYGPSLCLSPDARFLLTVHTNQTFILWNALELTAGKRHALPFDNTSAAAASPGGELAAFASQDGKVSLWDAKSDQCALLAQLEPVEINRLTFSPDGRRLATGSASAFRVFDLKTRKPTHGFSADGLYALSLTFSGDGESLMAGSYTGDVKLWRLSGSTNAINFLGHQRQVRGLSLSPDGRTLFSAAHDGTIRFWDVLTGEQKVLLNPREGFFYGGVLSPDGRRLAVGFTDGSVTFWDPLTRQEMLTLKGHRDAVMQLGFTPDGKNLVSVSRDQLRFWRTATFAERNAAAKTTREKAL
jgi:WD40 repeat protein